MEQKDKDKGFNKLIELGVLKLEVKFSGGNDEGGADEFIAYGANGQVLPLPQSKAYQTTHFNNDTKKLGGLEWVVFEHGTGARAATEQEIELAEVMDVLESPIYEVYYGFAFDGYVSGTLVWDVAEGTVIMDREEEEKQMVHSTLEF